MNKTIKKSLSVVLAMLTIVCLLVGVSLLPANKVVATAPTTITFDGDFTQVNGGTTYAAVGGATSMGGGITSASLPTGDNMVWNNPSDLEGADGKYIQTSVHPWNFRSYQRIIFNTPVTVTEDITSMTFRMYLDLSQGDTYGIGNDSVGIWLYALDETGLAGEGVLIPNAIKQRQWVDFTILDADFEKFVDAEGEVKGFKMASGIVDGGNQNIMNNVSGREIAFVHIDTITFGSISNYLKKSDFVDGKATLFTANGDYSLTSNKNTNVEGMTLAQLNSAWAGNGFLETAESIVNLNDLSASSSGAYYDLAATKSGSTDGGYATGFKFSNWGYTFFPAINFNKTVKASSISSLTFRVYANISSNASGYGSYNTSTGKFSNSASMKDTTGIYFYSIDSNRGAGEGVLLNPVIKQREWAEFTITGKDLVKLADNNGVISGISMAAGLVTTGNGYMYAPKTAYDIGNALFIDEITVTDVSSVEEELVIFDGKDISTTSVFDVKVEGMTTADLKAAWPGPGLDLANHTVENLYDLSAAAEGALYDIDAVKSGSTDGGYAAAVKFGYWGYTSLPIINFNRAVKAAEVSSLTLRVYANLSSSTTYGNYNATTGKFSNSASMKDTAGIYIYSADKNGKGDGFLIKGDVVQREWIDITICGSDLAKLTDGNGMITGIKLAAGLVTEGNAYIYGPNAAYDKGNALFIDSVTALKNHPESDVIVDEEGTCSKKSIGHTECIYCGEVIRSNVEGDFNPDKHTLGGVLGGEPAGVGVAGTIEHKQCADCEKLFDLEGNEISSIVVPALKGVMYASLSVAGDIGINFYVYMGEDASATATFTFNGATSDPVNGVYDDATKCFKFSYGVAPKDYKQDVTINVEGIAPFTYSVEDYAASEDIPVAAEPLVEALINYAEAARVFFAEETAVATEDLTADLSGYKATVAGEDAAVEIYAASLVVEDLTTIKVYFKASSAVTVTVDGDTATAELVEGDLYVVEIANIAAKDLAEAHTVVIGGITVTYSALSYVESVLALDIADVALNNVVKAIYNAYAAASAYFNA